MRVLGRVPHEDLSRLVSDVDGFVLASHLEGHPKSLIEAMYFGMPILAADSPGINELIIDGHNGSLTGTSVDALRNGIKRFRSSSPAHRQDMAERARAFAMDNFSLPSILRKELAAYRQLLRARADTGNKQVLAA